MRPAGKHEHAPIYAAARESAIDLTELRKLSGTQSGENPDEMIDDLIELFLQVAPQAYASIRAAQAEGDAQSLGRTAHKLKSQAAYFGAQRMTWLCQQLASLGYESRLQRCAQLVDDLEDELDRVMLALARQRPARR